MFVANLLHISVLTVSITAAISLILHVDHKRNLCTKNTVAYFRFLSSYYLYALLDLLLMLENNKDGNIHK